MVPPILMLGYQRRLILKQQVGQVEFLRFSLERKGWAGIWCGAAVPTPWVKEWARCSLVPQAEADMGNFWYFCHTQIPILMTPVSFYQTEQYLFLGDSDVHFLELIKRCTKSFMLETCLATLALGAGEDQSLWGNWYSGHYWVSRHLAQIVSLSPSPWVWKFPDCPFPIDKALYPCRCWLVCPIFHQEATPMGLHLQETWRQRPDAGAGVGSEISHVDHIPPCLRVHFSPVPWNLKQVALIDCFSLSQSEGEHGKKRENLLLGWK